MKTRHWCALCNTVSAVTAVSAITAVPGTEENDRLWLSACSLSTPRPLLFPLLGALPQGRGRKKGTCLLVLGSTFILLPLSTLSIHTVKEQKQTPQGWALPLLPLVQQPGK